MPQLKECTQWNQIRLEIFFQLGPLKIARKWQNYHQCDNRRDNACHDGRAPLRIHFLNNILWWTNRPDVKSHMPDRIETHRQQAWHWYHPELPARSSDSNERFRKKKSLRLLNFQKKIPAPSPSTQAVRQSSKVIFPYIICLLIDLFVSRKCTSSIFRPPHALYV